MTSELTPSRAERRYDIKVLNPFVPIGPYRDRLPTPLSKLFPYLTEREREELIYAKLMLEQETSNQSAYAQAACELTVCSWFAHIATSLGERFEYEHRLAPPKDVDCAVWHQGHQFNIEVKCADYAKHENIVSDSDFIIHGLGRLDGYGDAVTRLQDLFGTSAKPAVLGAAHHMDCKLKDYLLSAQGKFGEVVDANSLNVLFVCVDDQMDMTKWIAYLNGPRGLFTKQSFEPQENYWNVDLVVFSNLYHRHANLENKDKITAHWDLSQAFNFALVNPQSMKSDDLYSMFARLVPLENNGLLQFIDQLSGEEWIKSAIGLCHYVGDQISKGIHKFQGYPVDEG
jgi:hypothetical protein